MWENNGWGLGGNGFYFFTKFGKITVVEMASQKLVETSRLVQSVRWNVQLALSSDITVTNLWEFAAMCTVVTKQCRDVLNHRQ
jgi:hypothetical protein